MSLEAAIMGFLAEQPRSGYDLKTRCFDEQAKPFWSADQAQIYRTLDRLRTARMVTCTRQRQLSKPDRKTYRLTVAGAESLRLWLASATPPPSLRDASLMQVRFSAALTDREIVLSLSEQRHAHQSRLEELRRELSLPAEEPLLTERTRTLRAAAIDGAIARERASVDWLDDTIEAIEAGRLPAEERVVAADSTQLTERGSA